MAKLVYSTVLVLTLAGCVTAEPAAAPVPTPSAPQSFSASAVKATPQANTEAQNNGIAASPAPHAPVTLTVVHPADPTWQQRLSSDATDLQTRGNAFLEASFDLYDQLLDESPATPERTRKVNDALKRSAALYTDLTGSVARLRADLDRPDVRAALPTADDEDQRELETMSMIFPNYATHPVQVVAYDMTRGPSVTTVLFDDHQHSQLAAVDGLPKAQRDALLLLDYLRDVSNDMAFMSQAVGGWTGDVDDGDTGAGIAAH